METIKKDELRVKRLHFKYELIVYTYILYRYLWVIWFNGFSFVLFIFLAALHPKISLYKFISDLRFNHFASTRPF